MLMTREVDYALRILRALADGNQIATGTLCKSEQIPQQFAYKIIRKLGLADYITIARGAEGGIRLKVDLHRITLYDLMEKLQAVELVNDCMQPGYECTWRQAHGEHCHAHEQLCVIQGMVDQEFKNHDLYSVLCGDREADTSAQK